ncbi:MAG: phosphotransferase [Eubacteriales bacterium]|nr:phosphotransferase [Eubacteriales bacterium]
MTSEQIKTILSLHKLPVGEIEKCNVGFRNEVWFIGDYVVKLYGKNTSGYAKELWFYKTASPSYAPELIAYGENYIILSRIRGEGLYHLWRDMDNTQREATVEKIADIACKVNRVSLKGGESYFNIVPDWKAYMLSRIECDLEELEKINGIPPFLAEQVRSYMHENSGCLDDKTLYLVYADLHFDNLIIDKTGKPYLLDYEMLETAPRDFVLDVWQRMTIHPFTYANEADHELTLPKDYTYILSWMRKYAPELFDHPRVSERVNLYGILYELDILRDYPMGDWPIERMEKYLKGVEW